MAEIVEYRVEKTLDELNLLVEFGLFTRDQAKEVITKRENFEYILRRRNRTKLDYLKYIRFEVNLLESIDKYRKTVIKNYYNKRKSDKLEDIENKIVFLQAKKLNDIVRSRSAHISSLFRKLTISFQFDKKLWLAYIEFAKSRHWNTRASTLYWRLLRVCNNDEDVWLAAASHETENNKTFDVARGLYLRALRHFPRSSKIWAEYFKMELRFMEVVDQRARILFKIANTPNEGDKADDGNIWDEQELELNEIDIEKEDANEEGYAEESDEQRPKVSPVDDNDSILSGHLPRVVYDNADKKLVKRIDFCNFLLRVFLHMMSDATETRGLISVRHYIHEDIKKKKEEEDSRIDSELVEALTNKDLAKELGKKLNIFEDNIKDEPAKRLKKSNLSKLDMLYDCYDSKGLEETRSLFKNLEKSIKSQSLSLYVGMIQVESWHLKEDSSSKQRERIRALYDKALSKFGTTKPKLWYEYLQFEQEQAKSLHDLERVNQLYSRALATLEPSRVNKVIEKYTLLQTRASGDDINYSDYSDLDD